MRTKDKDAESGFTLIEVLVALALTAMIATFVLGGFDFARRAWFVSATTGRSEEIDAAARRLRDLVSKTVPALAITSNDGLARLWFDGTAHTISFVTLSEAESFPGGMVRILLSWSQSDGTDTASVVLTSAVFRSGLNASQDMAPVTLLRGVKRLSVAYFGSGTIGEPPEWKTEWRGRAQLPLLVHFEADVVDNGRVRRLVIPVSLRLSRRQ